jgi:hypothetical protein
MPNKPIPLTGQNRENMISYIHQPLIAWLNEIMKGMFVAPRSSDACDVTAEAVARALRDTIGAQPYGKAILQRLALDILDETNAKASRS